MFGASRGARWGRHCGRESGERDPYVLHESGHCSIRVGSRGWLRGGAVQDFCLAGDDALREYGVFPAYSRSIRGSNQSRLVVPKDEIANEAIEL